MIIVGEAPSRIREGLCVLDGNGVNRLAALMGVEDLRDVARVVNLLGYWPGSDGKGSRAPMPALRAAAAGLEPTLRGEVLLLGHRVSCAFGIAGQPYFKPVACASYRLVVLPHPSGVNHWWNEERNVQRARRFLRRMARQEGTTR